MTKARTTRAPIRTEAATPEPVREPIRAKTRTRKGVGVDQFNIPPELIPDGIDFQWNVDTVTGQPSVQERTRMEQQAWEAATITDFPFLDGMFMRKGHLGEINVGGLVLMWRPLELTIEARAEEYQAARNARHVEERKITSGNVDGVDPNVLDAKNPHARQQTFLKKERVASMPVQD